MSKSGFSLNDKNSKILADCRAEINKNEFQAEYDRRSIQKLNRIIESQLREINHTFSCDAKLRRDQLLHEQFSEQNRDLREAHMKSLDEMEDWNDFKGQQSIHFRRENWSKIETLSLNSQPRFRNYKMKLIVWMIREFFKMLKRSGQSHVASQPVSFPPHPVLAKPFSGNAEPQKWAAKHLGHKWCIGKRFRKSNSVFFFSTLSAGVESMEFWYINQNTHHHVWRVKTKHQFRIRDASQGRQPNIQSSLVREDFQRISGQTNNDCRFRIFILTNSLRQQPSLAGR